MLVCACARRRTACIFVCVYALHVCMCAPHAIQCTHVHVRGHTNRPEAHAVVALEQGVADPGSGHALLVADGRHQQSLA